MCEYAYYRVSSVFPCRFEGFRICVRWGSGHSIQYMVEVLGVPAAYARKLRNEALLSCAGNVGLMGLSAAIVYVYYLFGVKFSVVSLTPPFVLFLYASYMLSSARIRYAKANVGVRAEVRVSKTLVRCAPYALVHGSTLGFRGDIDHIVVGPCLATVETKYGVGKVGLNAENNLVCGGKIFKGDPIAQASRAADAVSKHAGVDCDAVVVVTDGTTPPFRHRGVTVCSLKDLVSVLSSFPNTRVSADRAARLAESLYVSG